MCVEINNFHIFSLRKMENLHNTLYNLGMKKKITVLFLVFSFVLAFTFASVDLEIPASINLGISEVSMEGRGSMSHFFPYFDLAQINCAYVFNDFTENSPWNFSAGGSLVLWPFQSVCATGSAFFTAVKFENGATLDLANILALGLLMVTTDYFDLEQG